MFMLSALMASPSFLPICSPARWGSRSLTISCGSEGSRPMTTSMVSPAAVTTVPCSSRGMAVHWYFLMPP